MIQKSSASLHGALFSELKELLALIGDSKKAKEQLALLDEEISLLKEMYLKNKDAADKSEALSVSIQSKLSDLAAKESSLKEESAAVDKKKAIIEDGQLALSQSEKSLKIKQDEFESAKKQSEESLAALEAKASKSLADANEKSAKADALIAEYEEKLSKLKAMVG